MEHVIHVAGLVVALLAIYTLGLHRGNRIGWRAGFREGADLGIKTAVWLAGRAQQNTPGQPIDLNQLRFDARDVFKL